MNQAKKRVLIVEDEAPERMALVRKIEQAGFETLEAKDGVEGLKSALENHPDLVLSDIILPKLDGIKLVEQLREDAWGKGVPVIFLTNLSDPEKTAEASKQGVSDFLIKSDSRLEEVVALVRKKIGDG